MASVTYYTEPLTMLLKKADLGTSSAAHGLPAGGAWLVGEAGSGKTRALELVKQRVAESFRGDSHQPVLFLTLKVGPTRHSVMRDMAEQLKYPFNNRTYKDLEPLLFRAMREKPVRAVLMQEVQHFTTGNGVVHMKEFRDFIKDMWEETRTFIVLSGIRSVLKLRDDGTEEAEQLESRLPSVIRFKTDYNSPDGRALLELRIQSSPIPFTRSAKENLAQHFASLEKASARLMCTVTEEALKAAALRGDLHVDAPHVAHGIAYAMYSCN